MRKVLNRELVIRRFDVVARAMDWDTRPWWTGPKLPTTIGPSAIVGRVRLSKYGRADRWSIDQCATVGGGEHTIHSSCTSRELVEWLDGILLGIGRVDAPRVRTAWAASYKAHPIKLPKEN